MLADRFFHLDCNPVIPECGYECGKCIGEILAVLRNKVGVCDVSLGKHGEISGIKVKFELEKISDDDLLEEFRKLPSFYRGRFVPNIVKA